MSEMTTVCNVRRSNDFDVYIGRKAPGWPASPWANPFRIGDPHPVTGKPMGRHDVVAQYRVWINNPEQAALRARLPELRGLTLGCWCFPLECHGDILAEMADRQEGS